MSVNPQLILSCARDNKPDMIEALVNEHGVPADYSNRIGQTALHIASLHGNLEAAQKLLELGCPVNVENDMQQTPLHFAAQAHSNVKEICIMLLAAGADTGACDFRGVLPYENATDSEVRRILDGPDPRLFDAAASGDVEQLKALFLEDPELDPAPFHQDGVATTHLAAKNGHVDALAFLLDKEAFVDQQDLVQGDSILHHAVRKGDIAVVELLLSRGANINTQNFHKSQYSHGNWMSNGATLGPLHQTPLGLAIDLGELEVAKALLKKGAAVDPIDFDGRTPLHTALEMQEDDAVELLLSHGADPNIGCKDFGLPLHLAASQGASKLIQALLDKGATVDATNEQGWTALMLAARSGKLKAVEVLLKAGASVSAVNDQGNTALHLSAANGRGDVVKALVEAQGGKEVFSVKNKEGKTPLELSKNEEVQKLLQ